MFCGVAVLAMLAIVVGCGDKQATTAAVEGVVTYKGAPLPAAVVTFLPSQGRPATGTTDEQGRFRLTTLAPGDGAVPGEHTVLVSKSEPAAADPKNPYAPPRSLIPESYGRQDKSNLKASVAPGKKNEFRFELE